jgi:TatD DNase family protein
MYFCSMWIDCHTHGAVAKNGFTLVNTVCLQSEFHSPSSLGIHPWWLGPYPEKQLIDWIETHLENPHVLAIGECGLDRLHPVPLAEQMRIFEYHIEWAQSLNKPMILHCVRAFPEIIQLLKPVARVPIIFHGFRGSWQKAQDLIHRGYYLGIGPPKTSSDRQLLQQLPLEQILLETDDSGVDIESVYNQVAMAKSISIEVLKKRLYTNACSIFGDQINRI